MSQTEIAKYEPETTTETLTKTVKLNLETSNRKTNRLKKVVHDWQEIAGRMGDLMPSFPPYRWGNATNDTHLYRVMKREFPDSNGLHAANAHEAAKKVSEAFDSWESNGSNGDRPSFGDGEYARFRADHVDIKENDQGYGIGVKLRPREDRGWWHINAGPYQREYLTDVIDGDSRAGSAELHITDGGVVCHLTVSEDIEVYKPDGVDTYIGVDLGENMLYAVTAVCDGEIQTVDMESGKEFRHYRERIKRQRTECMENDDLRGVKAARNQYDKYTEHTTHNASKSIIDFAREHTPCVIRLEDLTNYRESASDAIHDWPFAMLQEQIMYKATEAGIPIEMIDPAGTSMTCRKCGLTNPANRNGSGFNCRRCGYEVHADVNAAANIAKDEGV